jgi:hypothetical protein
MSKHTPGPWARDRYGTIKAGHDTVRVNGVSLPCGGRPTDFDEVEANSNLVAAAPELLAALKVFTDFPADVFEGDHDGRYTMTVQLHDMRNARAAIAKAEGAA